MATFIGTPGVDNFTGSNTEDTIFFFDPPNLSGSDTVTGSVLAGRKDYL